MTKEEQTKQTDDTIETVDVAVDEEIIETVPAEEAPVIEGEEDAEIIEDEESLDGEAQVIDEVEAEVETDAEIEAEEAADFILPGVTYDRFNHLTKRNQQFLFDLEKQLKDMRPTNERERLYQEISQNLLDGQSSGQTARQLYGTPTEMIETLVEVEIKQAQEAAQGPEWLLYLDGALLLGSIFVLVTGMSMLNPKNQAVNMGIITVIVNYLAAGIASFAITKNLPNPQAPKGERGYVKYIIFSIAGMLIWYLLIGVSQSLLPESINSLMSPQVYLVIGALTFALRFYLRRRFNIKKSIFN